jgi:hypothetical protein
MPGGRFPARRVTCRTCRAEPGHRCRKADGTPIGWHHLDRVSDADAPVIGRSPLTITGAMVDEGRARYAAGESPRRIAASLGLSRNTFYRRVLTDEVRRQRQPRAGAA